MMTEALKPYPKYKESGLQWIGSIPAHWNLQRLGSVLRERGESNENLQVTQVLSVVKDVGVIPYEEKGNIGNKKSEDIGRYKIVRPDDLVVNSMNVIIGSVGLSRYTGCLSPVYYVLTRRSQNDHPGYLNAYFQTKPFQQSLVRIGNGILSHRMRIPMELLKCEPFPLPPPQEQEAIVRFLDWANVCIGRAIRSKRRTIALLNEQKQAIIQRAVTRGIDSTASFKPSGIPWLGDIPRHWDAPLLGRFIGRIEQGWSPVAAEGDLTTDQWAVLTLSSVRRGIFDPKAIKPVSLTAEIPVGLEVNDGDFLLTRSNTRDRVGDVCIVRGVRPKTILCDLIYRLRIFDKSLLPQFLLFQLLAPFGRWSIERDARGSSGTMPKLSQKHIRSWRVLLPTIDEQRAIVRVIESETAGFTSAIDRAEHEMSLLHEYGTRLIADVVTGKLDVRDVELTSFNKVPEEIVAETGVSELDGENSEPIEEETYADN